MVALGLSFAAMGLGANPPGTAAAVADGGVELAIVTMQFDTAEPGSLLGVLSKYVVLTRMEPGCRNVDLCSSYTHPGRYLLIQKWDSQEAQRRHFDSPIMVEMAQSCSGLLAAPPHIDLWDGPSAHDLR
jgi:quinol monooxygenase YgiN